MFSNILFFIFVLLLVNWAPSGNQYTLFGLSTEETFLLSLGLYALVLGSIYLQNRIFSKTVRRHKSRMLILAQLELLVFLACYQFVLEAMRIFDAQPFQTIPLLFALSLYLGGLAVFEASSPSPRRTFSELRLVIPFAIPYVLLVFLLDLLQFYPNEEFQNFLMHGVESTEGTLIVMGATILFMALLMVFLPYWIQKIWNCQPLEDSALAARLQKVCERAHFKHAGFKTWTVMNHSLTAAIIGIVPRFRYILFTKRLLHEMSPESIEAILVHEIGHSYHRHLLIYPFVIFGISIAIGFGSMLFSPWLVDALNWADARYHSQIWLAAYSLVLFIFYAFIVAIYFRIVFGFFSRLFERQADLHVFALGVPPQHMIEALDYIGVATGHTHHIPNWHHWGIQQRIDCLKAAMHDPQLVQKHDRSVRRCVIAYFLILAFGCAAIFFV